MRTLIRRWRARSGARNTYYAADDELARLHDLLAETAEPRERAKLLRRMADEQMRAVRVYHTAFGRDTIPHDNGRSMTESLTSESKLYRALGDVEHVVACNGRVGRNWRFHEWGETADRVLDRMAATPDLDERVELLDELYDAVLPAVGGQAAETVACLPAPVAARRGAVS